MNHSKGKARPKTSSLMSTLRKLTVAKGNSNRVRPVLKKANKRKGYAPGLLSSVGTAVGSYFGGPSGGAIGSRAGQWLGNITGMGDYRVSKNSLATNSNGPPLFHNRGSDGSIVLNHREFLQDVTGSTAFTLSNFSINPGQSSTFPFLSLIAANFEQYEFLGLVYEFKTTSATAVSSTNTALGVVVMSTNYDVQDPNFSSKQQMEAYQYTTSSVPSCSMIHPVECNPRMNTLSNMYIRTGSVPSGADQRFYDLGNFQIATVGMQAAATIGELWVSYSVRLLRPKIPTPLGVNLLEAHYTLVPVSAAMGTTPVKQSGSNLTLGITTTTLTLPFVGRYLLNLAISAATSVTASSAWVAGTGVTAATANATYPFVAASANINSGTGSSTAQINIWYVVDVNQPNGQISFPQATISGAAVADLFVVQIPTSQL